MINVLNGTVHYVVQYCALHGYGHGTILNKNTKLTTTNMSHRRPLPYHPAALPSIPMATSTMAPTLSTVSHHDSMKGLCQQVWRRCGWILHLGCRRTPHQKIEQWVCPWP
jgi:hypothetical protein